MPTIADFSLATLEKLLWSIGNADASVFAILNEIQAAIVQTQASNVHAHPTDCPQREKRGWTGDGQAGGHLSCYFIECFMSCGSRRGQQHQNLPAKRELVVGSNDGILHII